MEKHRQSIRLKHYDYAATGAYFVTLCTHQKQDLFGGIVKDEMVLNELGLIVQEEWLNTSNLRPNVALDEFVVMPNHVHLLFWIEQFEKPRNDDLSRRGVLQYAPTMRSPSQTVGAIVRGYKGATTKRINILRTTPNVPLWQRNYYERIIRNDDELNAVRSYIENNPKNWHDDEEHL